MRRIQRSWAILQSSFAILSRNKILLFFPIVNFLIILSICAMFILPAGYLIYRQYQNNKSESGKTAAVQATAGNNSVTVTVAEPKNAQSKEMTTADWLKWGAIYIFVIFIGTYLNVAFYSEILNAVRGNPVSIMHGFRLANSKLLQIFLWACLAGSVGILIKMIEERLDFIGQIIMKLVGVAWSVAALFAVPVIVVENKERNPVLILKKSSMIITRTWGESLAGYLGFGLLNTLVLIVSLFALIALDVFMFKFLPENIASTAVAGVSAAWVILLLAFFYIVGVAEKIYRGALFLYASEGLVIDDYDPALLQNAWKIKK